MPGPISYAAVALMARDRLGQIRDALAAKIQNGVTINDIERHLEYLARHAHRMMSVTQPTMTPPVRLYGPPLTDGVSKFLLLGVAGPDLPRYAAMNAAGSRWLFDTVHKGTRDEHRERVLVGSTTFPLDFWARVQPKIRAEFGDDEVAAKLDAMRAYVLGHLCHVAADAVSQPFVADVESRLGTATRPRLSHDEAIGALDVAVAKRLFDRGEETRGSNWAEWWPTAGDVPSSFAKAWAETLEHLYGPGARGPDVKGFGALEKQFASDAPPALSPALIEDGVATFRGVVQSGVAWDLVDWMGATAPPYVAALFALPIGAALEQMRNVFRETPEAGVGVDEAVGIYEVVVFPLAVTAIAPVVTMTILSFSYLGTGGEIVSGWLSAGAQLAAAVGFFATLGSAGAARWVFFFGLPVAAELANLIYVIVRGLGDNRRLQLALSSIFHVVLAALFSVLYRAFLHHGVEGLADDGLESGDFWLCWLAWFVILGALWMLMAILLRWVFTARLPNDAANAFVTKQRHYLQVFDDTSLFRAPAATSPTLADLFYPSGRRELLRIWWEGPENPPLSLRSDRDRLVFSFDGAGPGAKETVFVPVAPTRAAEFGEYLTRTVKDSGGAASSHLKTALVYPDDLDYELPPGDIFADHGDDRATEADHTARAAEFRTIGRTQDEGLTLHHAPKARQAVRFGRTGPVAEEDRTSAAAGAGTLTSQPPPNQTQIRGVAGTDRFLRLFRPGDFVETTAAPIRRRVVVSVDSDTQLTVATPFNPALAGAAYKRAGQDRTVDTSPAVGLTVTSGPGVNDLIGTAFGALFRPGDTIRINPATPAPQDGRIVAVVSDTQLTLDSPLVPPAAAAPYVRLADEAADGFHYVGEVSPGDDNLFSGETIVNEAADLAALLCLGATSNLLTDAQRHATADMHGAGAPINPVVQVFRNWNLDRRRQNEWKMLIAGGAVSEKRGDAAAPDPALPPLPGGWTLLAGKGERTANALGWTPLLRAWLDMARRPLTDTKAPTVFKPGMPTNLELSRGLAYLLDMRDPDPTAP